MSEPSMKNYAPAQLAPSGAWDRMLASVHPVFAEHMLQAATEQAIQDGESMLREAVAGIAATA